MSISGQGVTGTKIPGLAEFPSDSIVEVYSVTAKAMSWRPRELHIMGTRPTITIDWSSSTNNLTISTTSAGEVYYNLDTAVVTNGDLLAPDAKPYTGPTTLYLSANQEVVSPGPACPAPLEVTAGRRIVHSASVSSCIHGRLP